MPYRVNAYRYLSGRMIEMNHDRVLKSGLIAPSLLGRMAVISEHDPMARMVHILPDPTAMGLERVGPTFDNNSLTLNELVDSSVALLLAAAESSCPPIIAQLRMNIAYNQKLALRQIGSQIGANEHYWDQFIIASDSEAAAN